MRDCVVTLHFRNLPTSMHEWVALEIYMEIDV
jgi:hypothetical protein